MSNKEKLIEFILNLSNEESELLLAHLISEKKDEQKRNTQEPVYHRTIYSIKHNVTGREYIGCTENFDKRIKAHLSALRNGRHNVEDMQTDFDNYGNDYTICVLEEITSYSKRSREYELMDEHESYVRGKGYNYKDTVFKRKKGSKV